MSLVLLDFRAIAAMAASVGEDSAMKTGILFLEVYLFSSFDALRGVLLSTLSLY